MPELTLKHAAVSAVVLLVATFLFGFFLLSSPSKGGDDFGREFSLVLNDYEGKDVHLYEYRRQILVAYAWASWCTYCAEELKRLADLKKTYGDKVQVLAVNRAEPPSVAKEFTRELGLGEDITLLLDADDSFFKSIGGYAMPETVFIDASGKVVYHQRGPLDLASLEARMKELLE